MLSESLHRRLRELAKRECISRNQVINSAIAEKLSALETLETLEERARRGSRKRFERALSRVRNVAPEPEDRLP